MTSLPGLRTRSSTRCHSVGVSRTSPSGVVHARGGEVDRERVGRDLGPAGRRPQPALGRPEPRQQLVHAERLRDVVVGAGVERPHLVGLLIARRQHEDRHAAPRTDALDHLDAVDAGQPEVDDREVGTLAGRRRERLLAVGRRDHLVAAGAQVRAAAHAGSAARRRRPAPVVVTSHLRPRGRRDVSGLARPARAGTLTTIVRPPPGVSSGVREPPIASTNPRATARPSPTPSVPARSPSRWNGSNTRSRSSAGDARARDRRPAARPDRRRPTRAPAPARPVGLNARAFATRFATARSSSAASTSMRGRSSGTSTSTSRPRPGRLASARSTTSSRPTTARRAAAACRSGSDSCRAGSPTRSVRRSVSSSIVARNSSSLLVGPRHVALAQRARRGLDRRQRRAQVVRDGRQDARPAGRSPRRRARRRRRRAPAPGCARRP